ncbi:MAG: hypothetical protein J6U64_01270, partial [Alphaproteobacteria bacterium]|nr:hypothetical protein [Alphaproteobacteria bacterium]
CCTNGTSPSSIQGVPETEEIKQKCCEEGSTAYWNGSSAQCCSGKTYQSGIDQSGNPTYGCCEGDKTENPTQRVVSPIDAPDGIQTCCSIVDGQEPTAYWNGSSTCCPAGQTAFKVVGVDANGNGGGYMCCPKGSTGAVRGNNWGSVFQYCCEEGTSPMEAGSGAYICCKPGETAYCDGYKTCCPVGNKVDKSAWPNSCCPPGKTTCPGGYYLGGNQCCDYACCDGECCGEGETCETDSYTECAEYEDVFDENGEWIDMRCIREETYTYGYCV